MTKNLFGLSLVYENEIYFVRLYNDKRETLSILSVKCDFLCLKSILKIILMI